MSTPKRKDFPFHYNVDGRNFVTYAAAKSHQRQINAGLPKDCAVMLYAAEWQQDEYGNWNPMLIPHR